MLKERVLKMKEKILGLQLVNDFTIKIECDPCDSEESSGCFDIIFREWYADHTFLFFRLK
jgi:hypothetical protein